MRQRFIVQDDDLVHFVHDNDFVPSALRICRLEPMAPSKIERVTGLCVKELMLSLPRCGKRC